MLVPKQALQLWYETHMHQIKDNLPDEPEYKNVLSWDAERMVTCVIGSLTGTEHTYRDFVFTSADIQTMIAKLRRMGVDIQLCKARTCPCCSAYTALYSIKDDLF